MPQATTLSDDNTEDLIPPLKHLHPQVSADNKVSNAKTEIAKPEFEINKILKDRYTKRGT